MHYKCEWGNSSKMAMCYVLTLVGALTVVMATVSQGGDLFINLYYIVFVLFLVKCYDNKMVKSPGCVSVE